jgi:acylphosphatase
MIERSVHVSITGMVQGVGYRAWTEAHAADLRLRGWVRNRRDGSVEAVFAGAAEAVADMLVRCKSGPRSARVAAVSVRDLAPEADLPSAFEFRPTAD